MKIILSAILFISFLATIAIASEIGITKYINLDSTKFFITVTFVMLGSIAVVKQLNLKLDDILGKM